MESLLKGDRKHLVVALDHGLTMGNVAGLEGLESVLERLIDARVDGTLLSPGVARLLGGQCRAAALPYAITLDFQLWGNRPGNLEAIAGVFPVCSVARARDLGAATVKVLSVWGLEASVVEANLRLVAQVAEDAHRLAVPLMVEPLWFGPPLPSHAEHDAAIVHGARIALELGADILKVPPVGPAAIERMAAWSVPVMLLGGGRRDDAEQLLRELEAGLTAGARGVVIGRNVWQSPDMEGVIRRLQALM